MSQKSRIGLFVFVGLCFGSLVGFINTLVNSKSDLRQSHNLKRISHDIRETLSQDKGCTTALSTALIYPSKKSTNKAFKVDGFTLSGGQRLVLGTSLKDYDLKIEDLLIKDLNGIGKNSNGYEVFTAKLNAVFGSQEASTEATERTLAHLLLTLDNRDRLVQCSNKFSRDAVAMMTSLCEGSEQTYDAESGHCLSPRSMARQARGISSVR